MLAGAATARQSRALLLAGQGLTLCRHRPCALLPSRSVSMPPAIAAGPIKGCRSFDMRGSAWLSADDWSGAAPVREVA